MSRKSRQICTKTWHLVLFVFLPCSRNFLSTIFGIFGKFRIDIVKNKFETIFFQNEKKSVQKTKKIFFRDKKNVEKNSMKKSMKIENSKILFFSKKIEILEFSIFIDFFKEKNVFFNLEK